jgi:hypothetical protein
VRFKAPLRRWRAALFAASTVATLAGCGSGVAGSDAASRAVGDACVQTARAPSFSLVDPAHAAPGTLLVATPSGGPSFKAFLQFTHGNDPPITGNELIAAEPPDPGAATSLDYFAETLPPLRAGTTYGVRLQLMQFTNLQPECQRSASLDLGTLAAR